MQRSYPFLAATSHPARLSHDKWFLRRLRSNRLEGLDHRRTLIEDRKAVGKTLLLQPSRRR